MQVTALLTGRGNNALKDKNILRILGKPVLYYPAQAARASSAVDAYYCSSDDESILSHAASFGYRPILRPRELALPTSQHADCILHALGVMRAEGTRPDILVVLLANNVTIQSSWITECVRRMRGDMSISAVVPVYADNDHHPLRAKKIDERGRLAMFHPVSDQIVSTNRQDLSECLFLAHNFWVINVTLLLSNKKGQPPWTFMGDNIVPYRIAESIDIHKEADLYIASRWIQANYID